MTSAGIKAGRAFVLIEALDKTGPMLRKASARLHQWGQRVNALGQKVATTATMMLAPVALAMRTFVGFDDQMRTVKAVTGGTADEFQRMTDQAKQLGRTTSFTAAQVAGIQTELGKAGFKPEELLNQTPAVLDLARATDTEAPEAAGIMAATRAELIADGIPPELVGETPGDVAFRDWENLSCNADPDCPAFMFTATTDQPLPARLDPSCAR